MSAKRFYPFFFGISLTFLMVNPLFSQQLIWLGTLGGKESTAKGVSADGSVVVGYSFPDDLWPKRAFRWTPTEGMVDIGTLGGCCGEARAVSFDGSVVAGTATDDSASAKAFKWNVNGIMQNLNPFPGAHESEGFGISGDGSVVVGEAWTLKGHVLACRWSNGTIDSLTFPGVHYGRAYDASANGSVVVGYYSLPDVFNVTHAFRWTLSAGMQDLGTLGGEISEARGVSADGETVVGSAQDSTGWAHAFRWTEATGMEDLGTLGGTTSKAYAVSEDGNIIVGTSKLLNEVAHAFIWTADSGMQDLNILYDSLISKYSELFYAYDISPNGRFIVGQGYNSETKRHEGFLLDRGKPTGVQDFTSAPQESDLKVYYINGNLQLRFQLPFTTNATVTIYDILGRKIANRALGFVPAGINHKRIALKHLAAGIYVCQFRTSKITISKKFIIH